MRAGKDHHRGHILITLPSPSPTPIHIDPVTGGAKGVKEARYDLLPPGVLCALARHYGRGALKYAARNWELGYAWSLSFAALNRHLWAWWAGFDYDEAGGHNLDAVIWHAIALREFSFRHLDKDDRPYAHSYRPDGIAQMFEDLK